LNYKKDSWLIISYFSKIDGAAQAHWIDDRLEWFDKKGIKISMLSSWCGGKHRQIYHKRAFSISPADFKYELDFILKRNFKNKSLLKFLNILMFIPFYPFYFIEKHVLNLYGEGRFSWIPVAVLVGYYICRKRKVGFIYSTGGPVSADIVAFFLSRITSVPWIAELQDPLVGPDIGRNSLSKIGLAYIEKLIFRNSEKVIYCTEAAKKSANSRYLSDKAILIYPGANAPLEYVRDYVRSCKCQFIHLGSLYQTRNLDYFLAALKMVFLERSDLANRIEVNLYGNICSDDIKVRIHNFCFDVVRIKGLVSRNEGINQALNSDVLLLIQNNDRRSAETIPSKVYEYLLLQRKVLGLVYHNEELSTMLQEHGHLAIDADDAQKIKEAIISLIDSWISGKLDYGDIRRSELTVERAVDQIYQQANSLNK